MSSVEKAPRPEDLEAAKALLNEHPLLRNDLYARKVIEEGSLVVEGQNIDLGDFLAARAAHLEQEDAEHRIAAIKQRSPLAVRSAMVVHSVRDDMERGLED